MTASSSHIGPRPSSDVRSLSESTILTYPTAPEEQMRLGADVAMSQLNREQVEAANADTRERIQELYARCMGWKNEAAIIDRQLDRDKERLRQVKAKLEGKIEGKAESKPRENPK